MYRLKNRANPYESARACAECLKDLYKATGDWDLALSGYNGGYIWGYLKDAKQKKQKLSFDNFLVYLADYLNNYHEKVQKMDSVMYRVKRGDNLSAISKNYSIDMDKLAEMNKIKDSSDIKIGQKIKIPPTKDIREKMVKKKFAQIHQNAEYAAKVTAAIKRAQEMESENLKFASLK